MITNINNTTSVSNPNGNKKENNNRTEKNLAYIPNLESNFTPLSDEAHYRQLQEINNFVYKEISKYKSYLYDNDMQINNIKKSIKEAVYQNK